jgi:RNA polymerase sigma-70 factor (sigma-E family)
MMASMAAPPAPRHEPASVDLAQLHQAHYRELVRLASFLLDDVGRCEEVVQEAFVKVAARPGAIAQPDRAAAYLRSAVLNGARSARRRKDPVPRLRVVHATDPGPETPEHAGARHDDAARVLDALRALPHQQQAVLVLRYWLDLPESEIADTLGIRPGTVKTHAKRGLASLAATLGGR